MIKNILVALDGSKNSIRALRNAIQFAKQADASITGIFVIHSFPSEMGVIRIMVRKAMSKHTNVLCQ